MKRREMPMLANTPVVQAQKSGRQTQDRRPIKNPPILVEVGGKTYLKCQGVNWPVEEFIQRFAKYQVGDWVYVRETYYIPGKYTTSSFDETGEYETRFFQNGASVFAADGAKPESCRVVPSIHMPKSIARIWHEVARIRVERIQDISEVDAMAEGVEMTCNSKQLKQWKIYTSKFGFMANTAKWSFQSLWQTIYPGSWERNDWVFVYDLKLLSTTGRPAASGDVDERSVARNPE